MSALPFLCGVCGGRWFALATRLPMPAQLGSKLDRHYYGCVLCGAAYRRGGPDRESWVRVDDFGAHAMSFNAPRAVGLPPPRTVRAIYEGSDGDATKALYERLFQLGPAGDVALNLFRAQKNSARAKVYRGGNEHGAYRSQAYERKAWAVKNLTEVLTTHAIDLGIRWGWQHDTATPGYPWVLYVEIPTHGQASFHMASRGLGPDYTGTWDRLNGAGHHRIIAWCEQLLAGAEVPA